MHHANLEKLKSLRLFGMVRALQELVGLDDRGQLDFDDQLALLIERETADRIFADADHPDQAARQVAGLLRLGQLHGTEALQAAATAALSANVRSYRFVQQLLAKGRIDALEDPAGGVGPHANLRGPAYYH